METPNKNKFLLFILNFSPILILLYRKNECLNIFKNEKINKNKKKLFSKPIIN